MVHLVKDYFFCIGTTVDWFYDADWAGYTNTRRSITGLYMFHGDALLYWKSKKQDRVLKSSTQSEYVSMFAAWLWGLLGELNFHQLTSNSLHADNTSVVQVVANQIFHERTKHMEVDCHSIREWFDQQVITLPHISTNLHTADIFTKALGRYWHQFMVEKLIFFID